MRAAQLASGSGTPRSQSGAALDSIQTALEIDRRLSQLETQARANGSAVGSAFLYPVSVARIAGPDRYATAALTSRSAFASEVPLAFVATGTNFPDALAAGAAAAKIGVPVLLVQPNAVPAATAAELQRLRPGRIAIFGSAGVVSDAIAAELDGYTGGRVVRLAGANRYDTAVAISSGSFISADVVYVATGLNFPDALAAGPVAGLTAGPLLLVPGTSVPASVQAELSRLDPDRVVVLGSAGVVSDSVIAQIQAATGG